MLRSKLGLSAPVVVTIALAAGCGASDAHKNPPGPDQHESHNPPALEPTGEAPEEQPHANPPGHPDGPHKNPPAPGDSEDDGGEAPADPEQPDPSQGKEVNPPGPEADSILDD